MAVLLAVACSGGQGGSPGTYNITLEPGSTDLTSGEKVSTTIPEPASKDETKTVRVVGRVTNLGIGTPGEYVTLDVKEPTCGLSLSESSTTSGEDGFYSAEVVSSRRHTGYELVCTTQVSATSHQATALLDFTVVPALRSGDPTGETEQGDGRVTLSRHEIGPQRWVYEFSAAEGLFIDRLFVRSTVSALYRHPECAMTLDPVTNPAEPRPTPTLVQKKEPLQQVFLVTEGPRLVGATLTLSECQPEPVDSYAPTIWAFALRVTPEETGPIGQPPEDNPEEQIVTFSAVAGPGVKVPPPPP